MGMLQLKRVGDGCKETVLRRWRGQEGVFEGTEMELQLATVVRSRCGRWNLATVGPFDDGPQGWLEPGLVMAPKAVEPSTLAASLDDGWSLHPPRVEGERLEPCRRVGALAATIPGRSCAGALSTVDDGWSLVGGWGLDC